MGGGRGRVSTGWAGREDEVPKKFDNMQLGKRDMCMLGRGEGVCKICITHRWVCVCVCGGGGG